MLLLAPASAPAAAPAPLQWLDELLPDDAAELCRGRVRLVVTEVPSLRLRYLEDFESKQDLIDANSERPAHGLRAALGSLPCLPAC